MTFTARFKRLLEKKGVKWAEVSASLNIGRNQLRYWEEHNGVPDGRTLVKLAEYFEVSTDYLLGIEVIKEKALTVLDDPTLDLNAEEKWLVLKYRNLDKEGRTMVESVLISESRRTERKSDQVVG